MPYGAPTGLPRRGQTYYQGQTPPTTFAESAHVEGTMVQFKDTTAAGAFGGDSLRSNNDILMRLVRNTSGFTLLPSRLLQWQAGHIGKRVDGYVEDEWDPSVAGVYDEFHTSGVVDNDMGWLVVQGPTMLKTPLAGDETNVIDAFDALVAITAATTNCTTAGRVQAFGVTTNYTDAATEAPAQIRGIIGRALSAKTTAQTNQDLYAYIDLLRA